MDSLVKGDLGKPDAKQILSPLFRSMEMYGAIYAAL